MESRRYILDLYGVIRIDVDPLLDDDIVKLLITRVDWNEDRDGDYSLFTPRLHVDGVEVYGDKDKLIRLLHKIIGMLGEDAVNGMRELLEESRSRDKKDKYLDIIFPYTPHLINPAIEDED